MRALTVAEEKNPAPALEYGGGLAVSLARAEVDQQVQTARAFPRSIARAVEHLLDEFRAALRSHIAGPRRGSKNATRVTDQKPLQLRQTR